MSDSLGRGLESLIPKKDDMPAEPPVALPVIELKPALQQAPAASASPARPLRREESIFWIDVSKIEPNPQQPRRVFDIDELAALTASIREHGVLQPLVVTKREVERPDGFDVRYELIAGERRWRAAKLAGMREVPVIVRTAETSERTKLELALIENVQREDLNPMERARAFAKLVEEFGLMQKDVAERIGKSREVVANALRLLRLPSDVQDAILASAISESHARVLLTLEHDPASQRRLFDEIKLGSLSVRDAELSARAIGTPSPAVRRGRPMLDPDTRVLQKRLEEAFGTRVKLSKRGDHGRIVVEFFSDEELRGILERISKKEEGYV
ncbi:MAG: ParB/RepB/Spo0J family partition protein [bacterium]|nr:ParB/RepB/Spo0J family partition protein [bacterium]